MENAIVPPSGLLRKACAVGIVNILMITIAIANSVIVYIAFLVVIFLYFIVISMVAWIV